MEGKLVLKSYKDLLQSLFQVSNTTKQALKILNIGEQHQAH